MTHLRHFPESIEIKWIDQKKYPKGISSAKEPNDSDKVLAVYYDNEFRKWHYKLALIIGFIITSLFVALVGILKLF
jgi:hypothetical protein